MNAICKHADAGCNVPEGECIGLCEAINVSPQAVKTVAIIGVSNGRICSVSPRDGMKGLANVFYELVLKGKSK